MGFFISVFTCVLPSFEYHFDSLLLTFITGVCFEIPCSIVSCFAETSYLTFIAIQLTGCHMMRDPDVGNLGTDCWQFYILSFFVYMYFTFMQLLRGYFLITFPANILDDILFPLFKLATSFNGVLKWSPGCLIGHLGYTYLHYLRSGGTFSKYALYYILFIIYYKFISI